MSDTTKRSLIALIVAILIAIGILGWRRENM